MATEILYRLLFSQGGHPIENRNSRSLDHPAPRARLSERQIELTGFMLEEINDISAEEALERVHSDDREIARRQQRASAAGEVGPVTVEYRWRVKSGEYRWLRDGRSVLRDANGEPYALVGLSSDIKRVVTPFEAHPRWPTSNFRGLGDSPEPSLVMGHAADCVYFTSQAVTSGYQSNISGV